MSEVARLRFDTGRLGMRGCVIVAMPCSFHTLNLCFADTKYSKYTHIYKHNHTLIHHKSAHHIASPSEGWDCAWLCSCWPSVCNYRCGPVCRLSRSSVRLSHLGNRSRYWIIGWSLGLWSGWIHKRMVETYFTQAEFLILLISPVGVLLLSATSMST